MIAYGGITIKEENEDKKSKIVISDKTFVNVNELLTELNLIDLPRSARGCDFYTFCDCSFIKVDLTYWNFDNCLFERVNFDNCYLDGAQFIRTKFTNCRFVKCSLREGTVPVLGWSSPARGQTRLIQVKMEYIVFSECDLTMAYVKQSQLYRVEFQSCFMLGCDFLNCHLDGTSIFRCNLTATRFLNVLFSFYCSISNSEVDDATVFDLSENHKAYDAYKIYNQIYKLFKAQSLDEISVEYIFLAKKFERIASDNWYEKLWLIALQYSCGYGEKPGRVIIASLIFIIIFSIIYGVHGVSFTGLESSSRLDYAIKCLYYSGATFTTLGDSDARLDKFGMFFNVLEVGIGLLLVAIGTASFYKKITK